MTKSNRSVPSHRVPEHMLRVMPTLPLHTRFEPIYDNTFDDLIAKLNQIELKR